MAHYYKVLKVSPAFYTSVSLNMSERSIKQHFAAGVVSDVEAKENPDYFTVFTRQH